MLSIITAFYNSSKTLPKLIECLKNQSNINFEWIIIDDCSKAKEKTSLMSLVKELPFSTKVQNNEINGGPGVSRTNGLKYSLGDYVVFVDSDDIISNDFVEIILSTFKNSTAEIVSFDYARIRGENTTVCKKIESTSAGEVPIERFLLYAKSSVCGCAFSRAFLKENNIVFPELYRYEDWVFNIRAAISSTKIFYVEKVLYYYIFEPSSLVNSGRFDAGEFSIKAFSLINQELNAYDESVRDLLYAREVLYVNAVSKATRLSYKEYQRFLEELKKNHSGSKLTHIDSISIHQKVILKLVDLKMYRLLRFGLKLITK